MNTVNVQGHEYSWRDLTVDGALTKCLVPVSVKFKAGDKVQKEGFFFGTIVQTGSEKFAVLSPEHFIYDNFYFPLTRTSKELYENGWRLVK